MADYISVSQLNSLAKQVLNQCEPLNHLIVCGEISGFVRHFKSGHCYFSLKDENAFVKSVMFRDKARLLGFQPQNGMSVLAYGRATIYERDGSFQLYVEFMRPFGVGAAQMAFDALRKKLEDEGLFDPSHKRPLPLMPKCIGVVTSKTGAALQDVCNVLGRRWPLTKMLLVSVNVQGIEAEHIIEKGIRILNEDARAEVILVTRGGGSKEDLWVFNSERIARAAYACRKPVVSAVGHEIDYTILDYVADLRAPTPSAAAELCVPDKAHYLHELANLQQKFRNSIQSFYQIWYNNMLVVENASERSTPKKLLMQREDRLRDLSSAVHSSVNAKRKSREDQLQSVAALAVSLSPYNVLTRGYTIVLDEKGAQQTVDALWPGQTVTVQGNNAWADCRVEKVMSGQKAEGPKHESSKTQKF